MGAHGAPEPSPMTLAEWLETWFAGHRHNLKPGTRTSYANVIDRWIEPYIGGVRLRDLGRARVREWRDQITGEGCTPAQVGKAGRVLSSALGVAEREGLIPANPASRMRLPRPRRQAVRPLTPLDIERIRLAMASDRDALLWSLISLAGLRPQEARALTWGDIGPALLTIDKAVSGNEIGPTKTYGIRTVEIVGALRRDLDAAGGGDADELVVAERGGGVVDFDNWRTRVWHPAIHRAGVKATPYDGRHSFASLLIHEGRSVPYVAAAMGHASATTTLTYYTHIFDAARHAPAEPMAQAVEAARAAFAA